MSNVSGNERLALEASQLRPVMSDAHPGFDEATVRKASATAAIDAAFIRGEIDDIPPKDEYWTLVTEVNTLADKIE